MGPVLSHFTNTTGLNIAYASNFLNINNPEFSTDIGTFSAIGKVITVIINENNELTVFINNNKIGYGSLSENTKLEGLLVGTDPSSSTSYFFLGDLIFFNKAINDNAREYYVDLLMDKYDI